MRLGVCLHAVIVHAISHRCAKRWMFRQPRPPCLLQASVASKTASWTFATCLFSRLRFLASQNVDVAALQWPWMVPCLRVLRRMKQRRSDEDVPMKTHLQSFVQMRLQSGFSARMAAKQLRTRRAVAHLHNGVSVTLRKRADTPTSADRSVSRRPKIEGRTERIARSAVGWVRSQIHPKARHTPRGRWVVNFAMRLPLHNVAWCLQLHVWTRETRGEEQAA